MDSLSQQKVVNAGFTIIRADDQPSPRIKCKMKGQREWKTFEKFETKAARDRRFKELMELSLVIND
jgi:hypothetical protein